MMGLDDMIKHESGEEDRGTGIVSGPGAMPRGPSFNGSGQPFPESLAPPGITFVRTDSSSQEVIEPPSGPTEQQQQYADYPTSGDWIGSRNSLAQPSQSGLLGRSNSSRDVHPKSSRLSRLDVFRSGRSRSASTSTERSSNGDPDIGSTPKKSSTVRRLSVRLHLNRHTSSEHVPQDLPAIAGEGREAGSSPPSTPGAREAEGATSDDGLDTALKDEDHQRNWESRATILARENEKLIKTSRPGTPSPPGGWGPRDAGFGGSGEGYGSGTKTPQLQVSSKEIDDMIQEAIRLHEAGELEKSTSLFAKLADPKGPNNALSQVLYGLALRHGWGCKPDLEAAVKYLSSAASNAAEIEQLALQAGIKKGGAAKGELVLAIFELANCFRQGWGIPKDPVAAKYYYETAANLGDTDAMNEVAWCYLEGFGTKKDKFAAAKYYRLAEKNGNKTIGNSWIWKEKYDPGHGKKK